MLPLVRVVIVVYLRWHLAENFPIPEPAPVTMATLPSNLFIIFSDELLYVLKQKTARFAVHCMKGHAALIESSEFDGSEAKLSGYGRDGRAGIGVIARKEHDLPPPLQGRIRSKLCRRQMIERLDETRSDKYLGNNFRREETSQLLRSNVKRIGNVDNDLAFPLLELPRNILVSRKWDSEEDHFSLTSVLNGLGKDAGTEFFRQRRKRLRSTGVRDGDIDFLPREDACERGANLAGTNNGVFHNNFQSLSGC
jgi:hypothetical protein